MTNIGKSTSYDASTSLTLGDRYVTVTKTGMTMTLPASPVDGQTHSIKSQAGVTTTVKTAGGEAAHNRHMAEHLIEFGHVGYIQIDCGRIGGLWPAKQVADYAARRGVTYINHTFTSNLALSASLQPFAGLANHRVCEYPTTLKQVAVVMTRNHIVPDANGEISVPDAPGLGIDIDQTALKQYLVDVEIKVGGKTLFATSAY